MLYTILNMSITASVLIVIVLFVRVLLKRAPSVFAYMLWGAVLFRLLCPYSVALPISLFQPTDVQTKEGMLYYVSTPSVSVSPAQSAVPPMDGGGAGSALASADPVTVCTVIWAIGVVAFIAAGVIRTVLLKRDLIGAVPIERSVYVADHLAAPFTMGVLRPRIYLPSDLQAHDRDFVVMHERLHIRRGDHLVRLISFLALCLHWFNPLVHVMFLLSERDMERSCDEAVLRRMERDVRAEYASLLLGMTSGRRIRFPAPISFDGDPTRERIKNIMRYRRPRRLTVILLSVVLTLLFVALLVNPFRVYNENVMGADYAADEILFGDVSGVDVVRISADYRLYLKYENEWRSVGALSP
ncbi:MAG: hypothetical protein IJV98_04500, partial [Clostridia bacterium]|nr:hypothetical protein [Clostridia bacterium]